MLTPPPDFPTELLTAALREMWELDVAEIAYAPVGFGSHHWSAQEADGRRWFVTLDDYSGVAVDLERGAALSSAFRAARALADAGLGPVVAPVPARDGAVPFELGRHRWLSVTPWLDAERTPSPDEQTPEDRRAVTGFLAALHGATAHTLGIADADDLDVPEREALEQALAGDLDPGSGPYAARSAAALADAADAVRAALDVWDAAAARALADRDAWVMTHGEPHWRNVLVDASGLRVVDWDTARLAPAARDLWHVAGADGPGADEVLAHYEELTGRTVTPDDLAEHALRWDLTEVALYADWFARPHADDPDTETAWGGFTEALASLTSGTGSTASASATAVPPAP